MTKDEAMQLALEALNIVKLHFTENRHVNDAIIELEQQAVQEPTPWRDMVVVSLVREGVNKHKARELADHFVNFTLTPPLPEQRQPLTDEQIKVIHFNLCNTVGSDYKTVARAIEAAHNIGAKP